MAAVYPGRGFAGTPRVPTDTERLDWLERRGQEVTLDATTHDRWTVRFWSGRPQPVEESGPTLRDAIDAAMPITGDIPPPAPAGPTEER